MRLLFMCPHGAAKSVMAAAIARDLVAARGLDVVCVNAGTDPDPANNPIAVDTLAEHGLSYGPQPVLVDGSMIESADVVIAVGDVLADLPVTPRRLIDWTDVPNASDDADRLYRILEDRVRGLVDGLTAIG